MSIDWVSLMQQHMRVCQWWVHRETPKLGLLAEAFCKISQPAVEELRRMLVHFRRIEGPKSHPHGSPCELRLLLRFQIKALRADIRWV